MNLASLTGALEKLGFDTSLQTSLNTHISLQLPKFSISYKAVKERDVLKCNLFFQRKESGYSCSWYDAILRKEIMIPAISIDAISLEKLDQEMSLIDWNEIFHREQNIASIINDLYKLSTNKEGKDYAEQIKVKHWSDTPLEALMNITILKPRFEISQRFYFMDDTGISIEEAYRFLNNKWMERQQRKKPIENIVEGITSPKSKAAKNAKKRNERKG